MVLREQSVQVAARTYRSWRTTPAPKRAVKDAAIIDTPRGQRTGGPSGGPLPEVLYGRRKVTAWLDRNGFAGVLKHTVDRLMRGEGMRGLIRSRKVRTTIAGKDGVQAGDPPNRDFRTTAPNQPGSPTSLTRRRGPGSLMLRSRSTSTPGRSSAGPPRTRRTARSSNSASA
jgi:putative transposase